jgi:GNAT superfamily N-acetyltransferase
VQLARLPRQRQHGPPLPGEARLPRLRELPGLPARAGALDPRFPAYRQRFEIHAGPASRLTWWRECVLGPIELVEYRLQEKATGRTAARATLWEMDTFSQQWNEHAVGVMDLEVAPEQRRQGLGKFLLAQILRHLHEQFFSLVEVHALDTNTPALNLVRGLGFTQIDVGRCFRRPAACEQH